MYLGIDLTSSEMKPTACAVLSGDGSLAYIGFETTDSEILGLAGRWRPRTVAIDAPLGLPRGMCCLEESCDCQSSSPSKGRACEREMAARGIPLYFTTKRSIIKRMVYRGIAVAGALRQDGRQILEGVPIRQQGLPVRQAHTFEDEKGGYRVHAGAPHGADTRS